LCTPGAFRIFYHKFIPLYIDIADYEVVKEGSNGQPAILQDTHHPDLGITFAEDKLLPPSECEFEGKTFLCPLDPGYVLEREFGKDWRVPKKDFKPEDVTDEFRVREEIKLGTAVE
jgi:hypothetical protein